MIVFLRNYFFVLALLLLYVIDLVQDMETFQFLVGLPYNCFAYFMY